ncbi:hypothetical protein WPS_14560 [Vulcanimicrobium alpinum]|uniref:DsrE/DsrF-like family protein n=2 Tax=Vulcanimicrobium alpinum TaxID=3016050 RepID=A0AAN2C954_UNVUL|nr:hypothetical protein WPS_14560 [Vulcanimicrobium alpinum]
MRTPLIAVAMLIGVCSPCFAQASAAPATYSNPQPSIDHPRKVVLTLSERDPARMNEIIGNVGNIQKFYGTDNVRITLVVYGPGIHAVLKSDSPVAPRIAGLVAIGVDVLACDATLKTLNLTASDLIAGVKVTPNGLPAVVELQAAGWYYVRP